MDARTLPPPSTYLDSSIKPSTRNNFFFDNVRFDPTLPAELPPTEHFQKVGLLQDPAKNRKCYRTEASTRVACTESNLLYEPQETFAGVTLDILFPESNKENYSQDDTMPGEDIPVPQTDTQLILESPSRFVSFSSEMHESGVTPLQPLPLFEQGNRATTAPSDEDRVQNASYPPHDVVDDADTRMRNEREDDSVVAEGRVEVSSLPVVDNPLQKAGRYTVIRGRLPDNHPLSVAANNLGITLLSKKRKLSMESKVDAARRRNFIEDLTQFLAELGDRHFKIPIIGGGELDLFLLAKEVMLLGGVRNVVKKRAFRVIAQQLGIPKTCTSAASVMKTAYEKLLFHYEQRLAFGKMPENPGQAVNMKELVSVEREQEKKARIITKTKAKRAWNQPPGVPAKRPRPLSQSGMSENTSITLGVRGIHGSTRLIALITSNRDRLSLPSWAEQMPPAQCFHDIIRATKHVDVSQGKPTNSSPHSVPHCFICP